MLEVEQYSLVHFNYQDAEGDYDFGIIAAKLAITLLLSFSSWYYQIMFREMERTGGSRVHPFLNFALLYSVVVIALVWWLPVSSPVKITIGVMALALQILGAALMKYQLKALGDFPFNYPYIFQMLLLLVCDLLFLLSGVLLTGCWWLLLVLPLAIVLWLLQIRASVRII